MQKDAANDQYESLTNELFIAYEDKPDINELVNASSNLVRFFELLAEIESVSV